MVHALIWFLLGAFFGPAIIGYAKGAWRKTG